MYSLVGTLACHTHYATFIMLIPTYQESMRVPGSIEQSHKPAAGKGKSGARNYITNNHYVNFDITQKNMLCHIDNFLQ